MNEFVYLPLHYGHTPPWLFKKMVKLGYSIINVIINDIGSKELIERLSNPYWFQALGCALGFDWHSSGLTTVLSGVLKEIFTKNSIGVYIVGGKGRRMKDISQELDKYADVVNTFFTENLKNISKLTAKTDSILLQDGYELYHQIIIFDDRKNWVLIQQGMNIDVKYARRYHWSDFNYISNKYVVEPHSGILVDRFENNILNLIDSKSTSTKKIILDLVNSRSFRKNYEDACKALGVGLYKWLGGGYKARQIKKIIFPRRINWNKVKKLYEERPTDITELLGSRYVDKKIIRGLALVSYLIYGSEIEWKDTLKYTFTVGGKDGVPYPIDTATYNSIIDYFEEIVNGSEIQRKEKIKALQRLSRLKIV